MKFPVDIICHEVSNQAMNIILNPSYWAIVAVVLMLAEIVIPGGIVIFLGGGALVVAAALWVGILTSWVSAFTLFFISSLLLIFGLRSVVSRFADGDFSRGNTVEILDEIDHVVDVLSNIGPGQSAGTVLFRGTRWKALGGGEEIPQGSQARIVSRENTTLIVEAVTPDEAHLHGSFTKPQ